MKEIKIQMVSSIVNKGETFASQLKASAYFRELDGKQLLSYFDENGKVTLVYSPDTKPTIKLFQNDEKEANIILDEDFGYESKYYTPYGYLDVVSETETIRWEITDDKLDIELVYKLDLSGEEMKVHIHMINQ